MNSEKTAETETDDLAEELSPYHLFLPGLPERSPGLFLNFPAPYPVAQEQVQEDYPGNYDDEDLVDHYCTSSARYRVFLAGRPGFAFVFLAARTLAQCPLP